MDKHLRPEELDDALPEIESNEVVLVESDDAVRRAVEEVTRRLEAELADTRGELGARIAELEGEVEALREMGEARLTEIDGLQAELDAKSSARPAENHGNPTLIAMLHAELSAAQTERERLAAELDEVRADRERIQDDLAAQIANLAGQLAARDAEVASLQRKVAAGGGASAAPANDTKLEELEAENGFLQAEIDRLAAQLAATRRG